MSIILNRATRALGLSLCAALIVLAAACKMTMVDQGALNRVKDTTAPILLIASPSDGFACANIVEVRGRATDRAADGYAGQVTSLSYAVPGTSVKGSSVPVAEDGSFVFQFETLSLGASFTLSLVAADWNGNETVKSLSLSRDAADGIPSFSAVPANKSVTLAWQAVPNTESYVLYYTTDGSLPSESNGISKSLLASETSYTVPSLSNGHYCCFRLEALPTAGWSASQSDYLKSIPLSPRSLCPEVKGDFSSISLEWNSISAASGYEIWRRKGENGDFFPYAQSSTSSFTDWSVEAGQWYFYKVKPAADCSVLSESNGAVLHAFAEKPFIASYIPSIGTKAERLAIVGNRLFVADSGNTYNVDTGSFAVFDISAPLAPVQVFSLPMNAVRFAISGNFAYVLDHYWVNSSNGPAKIKVLDLTKPSSPLVATVSLKDTDSSGTVSPMAVAIAGDRLYVGTYNDHILVYSLSDPSAPVYAETITYFGISDNPQDCIAISGNYAYFADRYNGLNTYDLTTKSFVNAQALSGGFPSQAKIKGDYLYITSNEKVGNGDTDDLEIFHLGMDAAAPRFCQNVSTPGQASGVDVDGPYAFVADGTGGLQLVDVFKTGDGTAVADQSFARLAKMAVPMPSNAMDVAVSGNYAYVANGSNGVQIVDLDLPTRAALKETIALPGTQPRGRIQQRGSRAYFSTDDFCLYELDLADPSDPKPRALLVALNLYTFDASGSYVFAIGNDNFTVIDISDPSKAVLKKSMRLTQADGTALSTISSIRVRGAYAFIGSAATSGNTGLFVYDISDPTAPAFLAQVNTGPVSSLTLSGSRAYAVVPAGMAIVDISVPYNPIVEGTAQLTTTIYSYPPSSVGAVGSYAYACHPNIGLEVVDLSDPENPGMKGNILPYPGMYDVGRLNPGYTNFTYFGSWALVATRDIKFSIVNVSNPAAPVLSASLLTGTGNLNGILDEAIVNGKWAYITDQTGILVVDLAP